ncbi:hypothetical protein [Elizabethkingia anophelis]|uniref:Uncharacterized protein n=1 Tax=Elizabethkingia anophelis R26 TaxID=1246994 RepID=A0ABN5BWB6_9FLAO|nr:hypothetical protein [Elizabethkingia anophelis]ATC36794.1 hypothetical protein BAZ09_011445 [Elizabethkingia anophelis R26]ATC40471.1 hypothetical protein EAAG1_011660 [Elizabethkingia anophelis Ag1]ATC44149.1 hypothetical protein CMV41_11660 [Elizabethkingia anophelis]ATC47825.1 hypothetical protein CMV40_11660 [Elizabethkingia anophelis]ELR79754.1 hypothetical protein D505_07618 [Elizabethkingia anophelis R26]
MMQNSHDIQDRILEDVKKIASDIASVESMAGLITNYQKVQELYEKVAFLKMLEVESIDIHQRKNELEAMIEANPAHDKSEEALEKEREVEAEFEEDLSKDEASAEIAEIADEEIPTEKVNAVIPKTENIIENDSSEEEEYVNTLEKDQHESPEEIVAGDEQTEPVAETEEISEESKEDASITETEPVITEEETAEEEEEEEGRGNETETTKEAISTEEEHADEEKEVAKEPEYQIKELFVREEEGSAQMDEEAAHKVKLASIKGLKPISREEITNITENNEVPEKANQYVNTEENTAFTPTNANTSVQTGQFRLDLNDRMAFLKKLFNNDEVEMKYVLERLNEARTLDDAKEYLSDLYYDRDWKPVDEYAQRLWSLVESRFR